MNDIIKNTLADIYDVMPKVSSVEDTGLGEWHTIDTSKTIEKIGTPMWGKYPEFRNKEGEIILEAIDIRLDSYLQKMPHGIVDKKRPGIGATTLEINSNRNSIIVVPTKILAHNKTLQHSHTCYVGSAIKSLNYTTQGGKKEIYEYLQRYTHIRKFIVVADSLKNLIEVLEEKDSDLYNNYFFMVDEVDLMQSDSTFRPSIENVMDYYFRFNVKKRCLVTATMKEFSNPLLKKECRFDLTDFTPKRNLSICHTNNIQSYIKNYIEKEIEAKKILIAYNSVSKAKAVIYSLSDELKSQCGILCSDASEKEAGVFYTKLTSKNKLINRITFMTCSYFAGVDIYDNYHLLTVSDATKFFQILSIDKMTQIAGRCRLEGGLLSETIVYNTPRRQHGIRKQDYSSEVLKMSENVLEIYNAMNEIQARDYHMTPIFKVVRTAIKEKASYTVLGESINLTRENIEGNMVTAYFNIDAIAERMFLDSGFYAKKHLLPKELKTNNNVTVLPDYIIENDLEIESATIKSKNESSSIYDENLIETIEAIKALYKLNNLNHQSLMKLRRELKRNAQTFIDRFEILFEFVEFDKLIDLLWDIRKENHKAFRNINNAVILWALDVEHPFILHLNHNFEVGKMYSAKEIHEKLTPAIEYHLYKHIRPRASVSLLKAYFKVERPRSKYKIIGVNPYEFKEKKKVIKVVDNLNSYLQINTYQVAEPVILSRDKIITTF